MTDLNSSDHKSDKVYIPGCRSNIAAKFQYAVTSDLPPIGVFWDIENCQVPKGRSAIHLVQILRHRFFKGHREAEFMCVCDIGKERKEIISELNDAQVTVVHVISTSKNAADDKLKQCMRRFVDIHGCPSTVVLITSDVNFTTDLSDFRYRRKIRVILIHGDQAPEPLLACADECCRFEELTLALPYRSPAKGQGSQKTCELLVTDIPTNRDVRQIQNRLKRLSDNCGGRVVTIQGSTAVIRFANPESAQRARKRMDKEDVFGHKISVSCGYYQDCRDPSPQAHISRSRQSSNCGGSSRESSPVLAELNNLFLRQRSYSETALSQESVDFLPPPPPDLIRQGPSSQPMYTCSDSVEIKDNCDKGPSVELETIISHIKRHQSWNTSPLAIGDKPKPKNVGRVSPFLLPNCSTRSGSNNNMTSPECHASSKFQLFPSNSAPQGYGVSHPFKIPSVPSSAGFAPIPQSSSSPSAPLYTWNSSALSKSDSFRSLPVRSISPATGTVNYPGVSVTTGQPIELLVTNLDPNIEANEMKRILLSAFREFVMVLHVSILLQSDGSLKAIVKVPSLQDAQLAISQLHRRKIGFKRILISYTSNERVPPLNVLKYEVTNLLSDVPNNKMPLFKFRELFENRYHRSIGTCDLYKLKDVVHISDEKCGRMVSFHPNYRATPSPITTDGADAEGLEKSFCEHHAHLPQSLGWAEADSIYPLPNAHISLKALSPKVHTLLDTHQGSVPLNSFCACYEAEFGPLPVPSPDEPASSSGVSLEHLVACIPGVQVTKSALGVKRVQWLRNKDLQAPGSGTISPSLVGQVSLFTRELVDLLKNYPQCSIPFHKFIPLYHHHFGRQCRVSDYGYTKLIDLLEAVPHVVQILGQGQNRMLTLTHRSQMKRFSSDLLRILKSQPSKQLSLKDLPEAYETCIGKPLDITNYGICVLEDIVSELTDNVVVISHSTGDVIVSIPKREQTSEEMERTRDFSVELIEILSHSPTCSMLFNKFVPAYHHHFGKQCKVADFGFSKLIELFEALPEVLEISGSGEDKVISLTRKEQLRVLGNRMVALVCAAGGSRQFLPLTEIEAAYLKVNGHSFNLQAFGLSSLQEMVKTLHNCIKIREVNRVQGLTLVDQRTLQRTAQQLHCLLMENPQGQMSITKLWQSYLARYKEALDPNVLSHCFENLLKVEKDTVRLTPLQLLYRNLLQLLQENGMQLPLSSVEVAFLNRFGVPCQPALYGFQTLTALLNSAPEYFSVKGKKKKMLLLNSNTAGIPFLASGDRVKPGERFSDDKNFFKKPDLELMMRSSPFDLMNQPVPSSVPSPELEPEPELVKARDLMGFESPMPHNDIITGPGMDNLPSSPWNLFPFSSLYLGPSLPHTGQGLEFLLKKHQQPSLPLQFAQPPSSWLTSYNAQHLTVSRENLSMDSLDSSGMSSAQDTPTRRSRRNRIAAHFTAQANP